MSANKGEGTKIEILFGKLLWNACVRYRKNDKTVFGKPDFVIPGMRIAIFSMVSFGTEKTGMFGKTTTKAIANFGTRK